MVEDPPSPWPPLLTFVGLNTVDEVCWFCHTGSWSFWKGLSKSRRLLAVLLFSNGGDWATLCDSDLLWQLAPLPPPPPWRPSWPWWPPPLRLVGECKSNKVVSDSLRFCWKGSILNRDTLSRTSSSSRPDLWWRFLFWFHEIFKRRPKQVVQAAAAVGVVVVVFVIL